jgi:hypothetical protein
MAVKQERFSKAATKLLQPFLKCVMVGAMHLLDASLKFSCRYRPPPQGTMAMGSRGNQAK